MLHNYHCKLKFPYDQLILGSAVSFCRIQIAQITNMKAITGVSQYFSVSLISLYCHHLEKESGEVTWIGIICTHLEAKVTCQLTIAYIISLIVRYVNMVYRQWFTSRSHKRICSFWVCFSPQRLALKYGGHRVPK